jgi:two-component system chemotaxis sensor kinase CheA
VTGDGRVALILDVVELARHARVLPEADHPAAAPAAAPEADAAAGAEDLLLFRSPDGGRMVIPLALVARVEQVAPEALERSGGLEVLQYRGGVLPLIRVAQAVRERRGEPRGPAPLRAGETLVVVVLANGPRRVGLVVDQVLDIVHEPLVIDRPAGREGILGSAIVRRQVAEVFDVLGVLARHDPGFLAAPAAVPA